MASQQARPGAGRPNEYNAIHDRDSGRRIGVSSDRHRNAEHFTRRDEADDDLLAGGSESVGFDATMQQQEKGVGLLALFEDV